MKRFLAILAVCALAFSLCAPVEAKTAKAATMRLEKTQGTVTLRSGAGKTLTQSDGMKLYSGNSLADAAKSYAWVSLDSSKAVKLGASSSVTVKQSGKKLELNLTSGKLFFDVKTPLASDESLSIRTSTTVTGIRGTCGVVEVTKDSKTGEDCTRVTIFEGSVVVTTAEPAAGTTNTLTVSAGKWMQITSDNGRVVNGTIDDTSDLGFAMVDIAADPALLARINAATALGEKIKTTAAKQLAIDEGDEQKAIDALPANKIVVTDPVFSEPVYVGGGGSYVPPVTNEITLSISADYFGTPTTDAENPNHNLVYTDSSNIVQTALNNYNIVNIVGDTVLKITSDSLNIPENKTLNIASGIVNLKVPTTVNGTLNVAENASLNSYDLLTNNSGHSIHNAGEIFSGGEFVNSANGYVDNTGSFACLNFKNSGIFENSGTLADSNGTYNLITGGTMKMKGKGIFQYSSGTTFQIDGTNVTTGSGDTAVNIQSDGRFSDKFLKMLTFENSSVYLLQENENGGGYYRLSGATDFASAMDNRKDTVLFTKDTIIFNTDNMTLNSEITVPAERTLTLIGDGKTLLFTSNQEATAEIIPRISVKGTLVLDQINLALSDQSTATTNTTLLRNEGTVNAVGTCKISNLFGGTAYSSVNTIGQGDTKQNTDVYITANTQDKAWTGASGGTWEQDQATGATYYISYTGQP